MADHRLAAASAAEITTALHVLFSSMPIQGGADPQTAIMGYVIALEGRPDWAIERAVRQILRGEIDGVSRKFCPRPPELAEIVEGIVRPVREEIRLAELKERQEAAARALPPPKPTIRTMSPEERAASQERVRALLAGYHASHVSGRPPEPEKVLDDEFWNRVNRKRELPVYSEAGEQ